MKKNVVFNRIIFTLVMMVALCLSITFLGGSRVAQAASARVSISSSGQKVQVGESVYVIITITSSDSMTGFEGFFSYDNKVLQFVTGGSVVHGNDDEFQISDINRAVGSTTLKYSIKFNARAQGVCNISLKKPYGIYGSSTSDKLSASYDDTTIHVVAAGAKTATPKKTKKPNKEQTISPNPEKTPKEDREENTTPKPNKSDSKGKNKKNKPTATPIPQGVHAMEEESQKILSYGDKIVVLKAPDMDIPEGFEVTEIDIDGVVVPCYELQDKEKRDFVLVYGFNGKEECFYLYDREQKNLLPYEKVKAWYRELHGGDIPREESVSEASSRRLKYIVGILVAFILLMIVIIKILKIKMKDLEPDTENIEEEIDYSERWKK